MSNYRLEICVLNTGFYYLQNLNKLDSVNPVKAREGMIAGHSNLFYSVLVKHQLNMIQAWNTSSVVSDSDVDPHFLSKALLNFKGFSGEKNFQPAINSRKVLQSYEAVKKMAEGESLNKPSLKELATRVAVKYSIPPALFQNLIQIESGYDPKALSPRGAMGLGQIMPETARELGLALGDDKTPGSVWHAESNLTASARYLKRLYDKYHHEGFSEGEAWNFAAGAYNAGMGNIGKAIRKISHEPVKTWDQVAKVLPQVTGKYSRETICYVNRLRA